MEIKVGMKCRQNKVIEDYNFNYVGKEFVINKVTDTVVTGLGNGVGFGIARNEFENYFELVIEPVIGVSKVDFKDGIKTIRHDRATIVILEDGNKGVAKCLPEDVYDEEKGYEIAYTKAMIKSLSKKLKRLCK
jgi:hypothetical protein